jgi:hypothetical protein
MLLLILRMVLLRVLVRLLRLVPLMVLMLLVGRVLVVVRPLAILRRLPLRLADIFSRTVETYGKCVGLDDQLGFYLPSKLREVSDDILLTLHILLVLVCPICYFLRRRKEGMEKSEVLP